MIKILKFIKSKNSRSYKLVNSSVYPGSDMKPFVDLNYGWDERMASRGRAKIIKRDFSSFGHKHTTIKEFPNGNRLMTRISEDWRDSKKGGR